MIEQLEEDLQQLQPIVSTALPYLPRLDQQFKDRIYSLEAELHEKEDQLLNLYKIVDELTRTTTVWARAQPADKRMIVESLQRQNQVVGMTGDGVNDVPALVKVSFVLSIFDYLGNFSFFFFSILCSIV